MNLWKKETLETLLSRRIIVFSVLFLIMLIFNFAYLNNPPYWDEITGLHNQAQWLAKHSFDLKELYVPEQTYGNGGSLIYPAGIVPFLYGLLYCFLPARTVSFLCHLFNLALLAGAGTLFVALIRKYCSPLMTLLWTAAAFTEPILTGRMAAQGQEAALTFAVMLSLFFFFNRRSAWTLSTALLACFIKPTAIVLLLAYFTWTLPVFFLQKEKMERKRTALTAMILFLILSAIAILQQCFTLVPTQNADKWGIFHMGFSIVFVHFRYYYLWLVPVLAAAGLSFLCLLWKRKLKLSQEELQQLLLPILIAGYFAASFVYSVSPPLPRYTAMILPPLYLFSAYALKNWSLNGKAGGALILLSIHALNQNGALLPQIPAAFTADLSWAERSREFLKGVENDRKMCSVIEKRKPDHICILTKWPYTQMLTMPELGYVTRKVPNVVSIGIFPKYAGAIRKNLDELHGKTFLILYAPSCMEYWFSPPPFQKPPSAPVLFETKNGAALYNQVFPAFMN